MLFAFSLFKYFPYGGLQRDMLRMAEEAAGRGHRVVVFTGEWRGGNPPPGVSVHIIRAHGLTNHARAADFARSFLETIGNPGYCRKNFGQEKFDAVVNFNRVPGGDFYFAADNCLAVEWAEKHSPWVLKLFPRYRTYLEQERAVCAPDARTVIMYITPRQKEQYQAAYRLPEERFLPLPPGMNPACRRTADYAEKRARARAELSARADDLLLILVGSDYQRKGADRLLRAVAALPDGLKTHARVLLVGASAPGKIQKLAETLRLTGQVHFLGARDDVPDLLAAADLMVHPARSEATGTVLIESIAAGTPVIASAACGFGNYVADIDPEMLTPEPFRQDDLDRALAHALKNISPLTEKTRAYAETADFYRRAAVAVDAFERHGRGEIF